MVFRYNPRLLLLKPVIEEPIPYQGVANPDEMASATNASAVVTLAADTNAPIEISQIHCGFSATPGAGATLSIADGANTVWQVPIPAAGPFTFEFHPPRCSAVKNTAMTVTLTAGGSAIVGYVNVNCKKRL